MATFMAIIPNPGRRRHGRGIAPNPKRQIVIDDEIPISSDEDFVVAPLHDTDRATTIADAEEFVKNIEIAEDWMGDDALEERDAAAQTQVAICSHYDSADVAVDILPPRPTHLMAGAGTSNAFRMRREARKALSTAVGADRENLFSFLIRTRAMIAQYHYSNLAVILRVGTAPPPGVVERR